MEGRLHFAPWLLLAKDVGHVIGAESARGVSFGHLGGHCFGAIFAHQGESLADWAGEGAIGIGHTFEIFVRCRTEQGKEPLLRGRAFRGDHWHTDLFFKTFGSPGLPALPGAGVGGYLVMLIVDSDRRETAWTVSLVPT